MNKDKINLEDIIFKIDSEEKIELKDLLRSIWIKKITIAKYGIIGAIIGVIFTLTINNEYNSTSILFPEYSEENSSNFLGQLGGLAGFAGIEMGGNVGLNPDLYPTIIRSTPFFLELLKADVYCTQINDTLSVKNYLNKYFPRSIWSRGFKLLTGIPGFVMELFIPDREPTQYDKQGIIQIDSETEDLIAIISDRINCSVSKKSGLITIIVEMPDPIVAAEISKFTKDYIEKYLTEYKIVKLNDNLNFLVARREEIKVEFVESQRKLYEFRDRNLNVSTALASAREEQLEAEYKLSLSILDELNKQVEQSKIKVKEQTPVFKELQPPLIPNRKSKPRRVLIMMTFGILGAFIVIAKIINDKISDNVAHDHFNQISDVSQE